MTLSISSAIARLAGVALAALLSSGAATAQVTSTKALNVTATLASQCRVATGSAGALTAAFGTYTAFRATALAAPAVTINFECTRGLLSVPTFAWDVSATGNAAGDGILAGLRYSLTTANGARVAGTAPVLTAAGNIGTPDTYPVTVNGSMPAGQAGAAPVGLQTATRTLTVTF